MTTPHYRDVLDTVLDSDDKLLDRARDLLEHALRRQLWLMFLDEEGRQLPLLMPIDVPRRPGARESSGFARFLGELVEDFEAASVVIALERRGGEGVTATDAEWFRMGRDACTAAGVPLRGPLLCHSGGVRWVAVEDYAMG